MEPKKSPKADLENKRMMFFMIGMVFALGISIIAIEWKTYERVIADLGEQEIFVDDEVVPVTQRKVQKPPPPPPPEQISVVEDIVELEEELIMETTEIDQDDEVEFVDFDAEESDEILNFAVVENKPVFPGCEHEKTEQGRFECFNKMMMKHVNKNFRFPDMARAMNVQGKVIVQFVIEKDGSISNVQVPRSLEESLDAEAIRVIKLLPKFTPAKQRGMPVRMQYNMPINARLN